MKRHRLEADRPPGTITGIAEATAERARDERLATAEGTVAALVATAAAADGELAEIARTGKDVRAALDVCDDAASTLDAAAEREAAAQRRLSAADQTGERHADVLAQ